MLSAVPTFLVAAPFAGTAATHHHAPVARHPAQMVQSAAPRPAQSIGSTQAASRSAGGESIVVLGTGAARQTQTLTRTALLQQAPGTSPFKALSRLPGVMFTSSDPFGAYEWSQQIIVRGFTQDQLGFTMDGIPLGDLAYGNDNGLSINRALASENNGPATISQGAGALGTAASNNLGGTLAFASIDPTHRFGADLAGMAGSAGTYRTFARINSGDLPGGGRLYASYGWSNANKWKGSGVQWQSQANIKYIQPIGELVKFTAYADYSDLAQNDYQDLSPRLIARYGYDLDNITRNYALAQSIAKAGWLGRTLPGGYDDVNDVYWNSDGKRNDVLGYGRFDVTFNDHFSGFITGYGHYDRDQGLFATPSVPTPPQLSSEGTSWISARNTDYMNHREGAVAALKYSVGHHVIEGGMWFENNDFNESRSFYALNALNGPKPIHWYSDPFATQWGYVYNTRTYQPYIQDNWHITSRLRVYAGFKALIVDNTSRSVYPVAYIPRYNTDGTLVYTPRAQFAAGSIGASNGFLPQIGANYAIDRHNEVFADFSRNMAAFTSAATAGPFSTTQAGFDAINGGLKPQTSNTEEIGFRFHNPTVQASITGYYVEFANRLLSTQTSVAIIGAPAALANVGGVTSRGIEAAANWQFAPDWSLYASYAFNDSHYDDDVFNQDGTLAQRTKGKQTVANPRNLANVQLGYDNGNMWANAVMQFQDRRTYTYTNDQWVDPNAIFNLNLGYRFHSTNPVLHGLDAQINVTNLFNKRYVATLGTAGFVGSDPAGTFQTLQAGAPQMVFFTLRKHFD